MNAISSPRNKKSRFSLCLMAARTGKALKAADLSDPARPRHWRASSRFQSPLGFLVLWLACFAQGLSHANAEGFKWASQGNSLWNNPSNWSPAKIPGIDDDVWIESLPGNLIDLAGGASVHKLKFAATRGMPLYKIGAYPIGSQTLTFQNGGGMSNSSSVDGGVTFVADVVLGGDASEGQYLFSYLTRMVSIDFLGDISGAAGGNPGFKKLNLTGRAAFNFVGSIGNGGSAGLSVSIYDNIAPTTFYAKNTYIGATSVERSTLALGASDVIPDIGSIRLSGATLLTNGFDDLLGYLYLFGEESVLDFGKGSSEISFRTSNAFQWTGGLLLKNFDIGIDSLRFGTSIDALTYEQLALIQLPGYSAALDDDGYVEFTAVPEPGISVLLLIGVVLITTSSRRLRNCGRAMLFTFGLGLVAMSADAANYMWTGAVNTRWNDSSNWSVSPGAPSGQGDTVVFGFADLFNVNTINLDLNSSIYQLRFGVPDGPLFYASSYVIGAGSVNLQTLTIMNEGGIYNMAVKADQSFNARIRLGDGRGGGEFFFSSVDKERSLKFYGDISGEKTGAAEPRWLRLEGGGRFDIYGEISDGGPGSLNLVIGEDSHVALFGRNSYTGDTILYHSELTLGDTGRNFGNIIPDDSDLIAYNAVFRANGLEDAMGTLSFTLGLLLDFSVNNSFLSFADSRAQYWGGELSLENFTPGFDKLRFGNSDSSLTDDQLSRILLPGYTADLDAEGFVVFTPVSVPEPQSILLLGLGGILGILHKRILTVKLAR